MYTEVAEAEEVLKLLVEGCSINTIERVAAGAHHGTILKILVVAFFGFVSWTDKIS